MALPVTPGKTLPARPPLRWGAAILVALAAFLLWLAVLPALLNRDNLTPLGGGCWFRGYRDPVTGRDTAFVPRERQRAEACLARQWGERT